MENGSCCDFRGNRARETTAAFGYDYNDIDMFNLVGHGVCMGNGVEEVKKKASWVTTPIEQDGIKNGLIHLGVIDRQRKSPPLRRRALFVRSID